MSPEEIGGLDPEVARRAYYTQAPWKRIAVILAGPGVNILIAFLLFWVVLFLGQPERRSALGNLIRPCERGADDLGPGDRARQTGRRVLRPGSDHRVDGKTGDGCIDDRRFYRESPLRGDAHRKAAAPRRPST